MLEWIIQNVDHFYLEVFASILNVLIALYFLQRGRVMNDMFMLFLGYSFVLSASIDAFHAGVSFVQAEAEFIKFFVHQSWISGRFLDSSMMVLVLLRFRTIGTAPVKVRLAQLSLGALIAIVAAIMVISLIVPLPFVRIDFFIHHPYDLGAMAIFAVGIYLFFRNGLHRLKDLVYIGLLLFLIVNVPTLIIMSTSAAMFDTAFTVAHILKDVSYFCVVVAILLAKVRTDKALFELSKLLGERKP